MFGDLTYNNKTLKPIGRPVDDLKDLYAKKGEDYNYVIDTLNATETALNALPYEDKDKAIVDAAKQKYQDTFKQYAEQGDFENRTIDTKNLANDMANKYGLKRVQQNSLTRSAMIKDLDDRLAKGEITRQAYQNAVRDSDRRYGGVEKDEVTGEYVGNYTPSNVQNTVDASLEIAEVLKGWKASTVTLTDKYGNELFQLDDGRTGYLKNGTVEYVDEVELRAAAIRHAKSDPGIQGQFQEDTYFEIENLLDTGEGRRDMTANDIKGLISRGISKDLATHLGINTVKDLSNLDKVLEGKDLEQAYKTIKEEQLINNAISLGVSKESYEKYENDYRKDWLLEGSLADRKRKKTSPGAILNSYHVEDYVNSENLINAAKEYDDAVVNLKNNEDKLLELKQQGESANPMEVRETTLEIERNKQIITNVEDRTNALISNNEEVAALIDNTLDGNSFIPKADAASIRGERIYEDINFKIEGLDINKLSMQRLITRQMGGKLTDEAVSQYIKLDINDYIAQSTEDLKAHLIEKYNLSLDGTEEERKRKDEKLQSFTQEEGAQAYIMEGANKAYKKAVATESAKLRNRVEYSSKILKDAADKKEVKYAQDVKVLTLPSMSSTDENVHPIFQLNNTVSGLPGKTAKWMNNFSAVFEGENVTQFIENEFDVDNENKEIKWEDAQLHSTLDVRKDSNGLYQPVVLMTIPIRDEEVAGDSDKKYTTKLVDVSLHNSNPEYTKKYIEAVSSYRDDLAEKAQTTGLSSTERSVLDRINLNMYNLSKYAKNIDDAGLYDGVEGNKQINWWDGMNSQVTVYNGKSPGNFGFLLTKGEGDAMVYYGSKDGKTIQEYDRYDIENPYSGITPLGANSVEDLKTLLGNMVYSHRLDKYAKNPDENNMKTTPTKDNLKEIYFDGKEPSETVLQGDNRFKDMPKEYQDILGIIITELDNNTIEITKN